MKHDLQKKKKKLNKVTCGFYRNIYHCQTTLENMLCLHGIRSCRM